MFTNQVFFNAIDSQNINLIACADVEVLLKVQIFGSQFINGANDTKPPFDVAGPDGGFWKVEANKSRRIRIPNSGASHNFTSGGFASVLATSVDTGGALSNNQFVGYTSLGGPPLVGSVSGRGRLANQFRVPLIGFNPTAAVPTQTVQLCITPESPTTVTVTDRMTGNQIAQGAVETRHSFLVVHNSNDATELEVTFSGGALGVVSSIIQRRRSFRAYFDGE